MRGVRINALPSLFPHTLFRQVAMAAAKKFIGQMESRQRQLVTSEADLKVYGPYRHREYLAVGPGQFKAIATPRNPLDEIMRTGFVDFKIRGKFVAKYGYVPRRRCLTCKNEVKADLIDCPYCGAPINRNLALAAFLAGKGFNPFDPRPTQGVRNTPRN